MDEVGVLLELVKAYSPSGREEDGVRAFTQVAQSLGFATEVDGAGNGIARIGSGKPAGLLDPAMTHGGEVELVGVG